MNSNFPWLKFLVGIILFSFWHQLYDFFPSTWAAVLAEGEQESNFAHMKMLFYPYLLISCFDYYLRRRHHKFVGSSFFFARLLILVTVPWTFISVFYVPDALGIEFPTAIELYFSIIISWLGVYTAIILEKPLEKIEYGPALKSLLILFFASALIIYTSFSFRTPHFGFFEFHTHDSE
ncbi:DUF6512 family protein [Leptothoe spongobia]|uniref:Uncharacterized protein n=1 Tax=Leptothoe spongobia TAU-MAC 1115 TaxID=1967444 RepID=A0A947GGA4_9CYAN|nr:DUF6512 family protein [Leptothoe spongobia]MBT9314068.1 hypothetical protein [Leptothoe spongobia TAU-MAC 1115]